MGRRRQGAVTRAPSGGAQAPGRPAKCVLRGGLNAGQAARQTLRPRAKAAPRSATTTQLSVEVAEEAGVATLKAAPEAAEQQDAADRIPFHCRCGGRARGDIAADGPPQQSELTQPPGGQRHHEDEGDAVGKAEERGGAGGRGDAPGGGAERAPGQAGHHPRPPRPKRIEMRRSRSKARATAASARSSLRMSGAEMCGKTTASGTSTTGSVIAGPVFWSGAGVARVARDRLVRRCMRSLPK